VLGLVVPDLLAPSRTMNKNQFHAIISRLTPIIWLEM
jgi:hypothetical protein